MRPDVRRLGWRSIVGASIVSLIAAIALTWPLASHLADATPSRIRDARLTTWILAWDAHVLHEDPTDLFQSPAFFPERDTLAYSEHLFGLSVFASPVTWATGDAFVAHNAVFIASIAFAAVASFLAAYEFTGSRAAAAVGAAAYAFAPYWASQDPHIQVIASGWIPLTLFAFTRWWRGGRLRAMVAASSCFVMATLTSWYQGAFLLVALAVAGGVWLVRSRPAARVGRGLAHAALGAAIAAAVILPFASPYVRLQDTQAAFRRSLSQVAPHSATATSYLAAPPSNVIWGDLTGRWSKWPHSIEVNLFPGVVTVALALAGLAAARGGEDRASRATLLGLVTVGVVLSFGAASGGWRRYLPWAWVSNTPVFGALRAAGRAHVLTVFGLAMLAAFGARSLARSAGRRSWIVTSVLVAAILAEGAAVPLRLGPAPGPRPADSAIAGEAGAVLELPMDPQTETDAVLRGTAHWRPMANGYSGYTPASWTALQLASRLPADPRFLELLRERGIRTVVVDVSRLRGDERALPDVWARSPSIRLARRDGSLLIYELT